LYSLSKHSGLGRVEVHHAPWPLQRAEVAIEACSIFASAGIAPMKAPIICHFSTGVHVVSFDKENLKTCVGAIAQAADSA
jgi:uncharacterized protein YqjF (DUF2071 family)